MPPTIIGPATRSQVRLLSVIDGWEAQLRQSTAEVVSDVDDCLAEVRAGGTGFDDHFAAIATGLVTRAWRDAAWWFEGQLDLAVVSVDLVKESTESWRRARGAG